MKQLACHENLMNNIDELKKCFLTFCLANRIRKEGFNGKTAFIYCLLDVTCFIYFLFFFFSKEQHVFFFFFLSGAHVKGGSTHALADRV